MMRYQRVSLDSLPLSNGRKSNLRTCKEEETGTQKISNLNGFEGKPMKYRHGSTSSTNPEQHNHHHNHHNDNNNNNNNYTQFHSSELPQPENHISVKTQNNNQEVGANSSTSCIGGGGDILLQWGHKKRSRVLRAEKQKRKQAVELFRRVVSGIDTPGNNDLTTPNYRSSLSGFGRNSEQRSGASGSGSHHLGNGMGGGGGGGGGNGRIHPQSAEKRSAQLPEKTDKLTPGAMTSGSGVKPKAAQPASKTVETMNAEPVPANKPEPEPSVAAEKLNLELFEWPRIYIALSRKEKEDDFYQMKGTKLPQRPKKRAKNVDKTLQYCFPGMWLSDLTRSRYEVREKKCVKKRRRGLKGMESMDSESE